MNENLPTPKETLTYDDYLAGTKDILEASQVETEPYKTRVLDREFIVLPGVFSPKYFLDTEIFARNLPVHEGDTLLEIGPGTGAISITAAYNGASKVVAIDINPEAVKNTNENIWLHHMAGRVEVRKGDVYSALQEDEKFTTIFWNTPFGLLPEDTTLTDLEKSVSDPGYQATSRFIKEASLHLAEGGRVLIGFSTTLGRLDIIEKLADEAGLSLRLLHQEESQEVHPVTFEIFEATRRT